MKNPQKRRKKWCVGPEKVVRKPWAGRELDGQRYDGLPHRAQLPALENSKRLAAIAEFDRLYQPATAAPELPLFSSFPKKLHYK